MKITNPDRRRSVDATRGHVSTRRAGSRGITVRDATTESHPTVEIEFVGATVEDLDDGLARVTVGGSGGGPSSGATGSVPVAMLNNADQDLLPGDVVVVDDSADEAVTVTTAAASILIAGVVADPIAAGDTGPVLFNGYAPIVNTVDDVTRGQYAQTSTTAAAAGATASRVAGSFAVFLTGNDLLDFATDATVTELDSPDESLVITMPATIPVARFLLLALWLEESATGAAIPGWTQIGAEEDFWYFYRISDGSLDDAATATWTGASVAVAAVVLTNDTVSLGVPIEDHDYENTTAAAALSGMSAVPRYAIAGVKADAAPGAGWTVLAGGAGAFDVSGTPGLVQSVAAYGPSGADATLPGAVTAGNVVVTAPFKQNDTSQWSTDPRQGGTCPIDANMSVYVDEYTHAGAGENAVALLAKLSTDIYAGPYGTRSGCDSSADGLVVMEFENIDVTDTDTGTANGTGGTIDCGTFAAGPNDLVVMAIMWKATDGNNSFDPVISLNGFTQVHDDIVLNHAFSWGWVGYKVGDGDASVTSGAAYGSQHWGAVAIRLSGSRLVEGTLAGQYIATDAAVTSPFSGAGNELDAIFALNLMQPAKPSALLYGPDLNGATGAEATYAWQPLVNSGDGTVLLDSGTGNPIMAYSPV